MAHICLCKVKNSKLTNCDRIQFPTVRTHMSQPGEKYWHVTHVPPKEPWREIRFRDAASICYYFCVEHSKWWNCWFPESTNKNEKKKEKAPHHHCWQIWQPKPPVCQEKDLPWLQKGGKLIFCRLSAFLAFVPMTSDAATQWQSNGNNEQQMRIIGFQCWLTYMPWRSIMVMGSGSISSCSIKSTKVEIRGSF